MTDKQQPIVPERPRVKKVPMTSTWSCPDCNYQNVYREGIVSDPQNRCGACGKEVTVGAIRSTDARIHQTDDERLKQIRWRAEIDGYRKLTLQDGNTSLALVQARADVMELLSLLPQLSSSGLDEPCSEFRLNTAAVGDGLPRGYWPTLIDRGDGVKGHYCIGRLINPSESCWEFWNHGKWLSAGQVFIGQEVALATLNHIRATPSVSSSERRRGEGQSFNDYLAEQMKDPEFRAAYEQISAEEDARLATTGADENATPTPAESEEAETVNGSEDSWMTL